jgi:hypothetical protein
MPRVRCVQQYERNASCRVLLLNVTNPTLSLVRLRFAASSYVGEVDWENDTTTTTTSVFNSAGSSPKERTAMLHDLLVDERSQKHVNVMLETETLKDLATSEFVELQSAEDSFIELGGKSRDIPQSVQDWKSSHQDRGSTASSSSATSSAIRLVACSSSTAWFELTISNLQQQADSDQQMKAAARMSETAVATVPAVPLALQIQLGAGLWDSSLIQPVSTGDAPETEDWVSFDLVIVLA